MRASAPLLRLDVPAIDAGPCGLIVRGSAVTAARRERIARNDRGIPVKGAAAAAAAVLHRIRASIVTVLHGSLLAPPGGEGGCCEESKQRAAALLRSQHAPVAQLDRAPAF